MKNIKRLLTIIALSGTSSFAAPFMAVGDNAELFLTASVAVRFDSNIFLNATKEKSDTIFSFKPGFDLVFGKGSATSGNLYYREEIRRYSSFDTLNTSLADLGFKSNYDSGKTKVSLGASYAQLAYNEVGITLVNKIVQRDVTAANAATEFAFSEKTSLGTGLIFNKTDYAPIGFIDNSSWSLPVDIYHEVSPKLAMSVGYRYRATSLSGAASDSKDHFLSVGARGEFTPKLTGQLRFGYNKRNLDRGTDQTGFGVAADLKYSATPKTFMQLEVANDFSNSVLGESTKVFDMTLQTQTQLSQQWQFGGSLGWRSIEYPKRSDDYYRVQVGLVYAYSTNLNLTATYAYGNNSSSTSVVTAVSADYTSSIFSFGANIRY